MFRYARDVACRVIGMQPIDPVKVMLRLDEPRGAGGGSRIRWDVDDDLEIEQFLSHYVFVIPEQQLMSLSSPENATTASTLL